MKSILVKLQYKQTRASTSKTYFKVWKQFNNFVVRLDRIPPSWEEKLQLYCAYLVEIGNKSTTIKSYISAVKKVLQMDGYILDSNKLLLDSLTQSCRLINDKVRMRFPIRIGLLEMLLFELEWIFVKQPYLETLYKAVFALAYYGLFRIGELTVSDHVITAKNTNLAWNKNKIMFILYSSKTHGEESSPQEVKITSQDTIFSGGEIMDPGVVRHDLHK